MNVIKQIRTRLALTQQELAGKLGVAQTTLSLYERDEVKIPPDKAEALIGLAHHADKPLLIDFNTIYGGAALPGEMQRPEKPKAPVVSGAGTFPPELPPIARRRVVP